MGVNTFLRSLQPLPAPLKYTMEHNPQLKTYLEAILKVMVKDKKGKTWHEHIARLSEIVRICENALCAIDSIGETYEEDLCGANAADMWRKAAKARLQIAEIAFQGCTIPDEDFVGLSQYQPTSEEDDDGN